jgi:signal transduction histidine kinase
LTFEKLKTIAQEAIEDNAYIFKREALSIGDKNLGYIVLYTPVEDIVSMRRIGLQAFTISFGLGTILALLISIFFQRAIGRPIKRLGHAMGAYSFNEPVANLDIHTGDEIEELYDTFRRMSVKIQTYHSQQKTFFQNASHELKTPLMSIQGYAEAIKDGVGEPEESLDIIIAESQRLKKIVEEMILLTKLEDEQESFKQTPSKLGEILQGAVRGMYPVFNKHHVDVDIEIEDEVEGAYDIDKMTRAFINILGNCARYASTKVEIRAYNTASGKHIEICDDGPGFQDGEAERVFERFYKGSSGGTGIGLTLTKAIIERHGGVVKAENNPGGGAKFTLTF